MDYVEKILNEGNGVYLFSSDNPVSLKGRTLRYLSCAFYDNIEDLIHYESCQK